VLNLDYEVVFIKLLKSKMENDFQKRYQDVLKQKAERERSKKK
jgi:hypothetical protein